MDRIDNHAIEQFIVKGYTKIEHAFSREVAAKAREILWRDVGFNREDPGTWTKPVVRLGMYSQDPFQRAANTPILHNAFDKLIGVQRWIPCRSMGTFPVRFPSADNPGDTGWHVDASFEGPDAKTYFDWRVNIRSKGRGLLMLFLFSDVSEKDAPTRIRVGSHIDVAKMLLSSGNNGLSFMELAERIPDLPEHEEVLATGEAGTVYLCHPFIVHAAQPHVGTEPRFLAQPPLLLREELSLQREDGNYTPLEQSIRRAIV